MSTRPAAPSPQVDPACDDTMCEGMRRACAPAALSAKAAGASQASSCEARCGLLLLCASSGQWSWLPLQPSVLDQQHLHSHSLFQIAQGRHSTFPARAWSALRVRATSNGGGVEVILWE